MRRASSSTQAARIALFAGLYDGRPSGEPPRRIMCARRHAHVRVLNEACADDDPTTRRFSQLEIE
jgi:hypothetical protein